MEMDLKVTNEQHLQASPVKERYDSDKKARLAKASKDFESILTQMMLKSMNKTTEGGLFGDSESGGGLGGDVYGSLFEMEIAKHISSKKGLGIADMIYKKVTGEKMDDYEKLLMAVKYDKDAKSSKNTDDSENGEKIKINLKDLESKKFSPSADSLKRLDKYDDYIDEASKTYGVDKNIIRSVILTESAGNSKAVSKARAKGLMQLIDTTAEDMGVTNAFDPKQNILGGTKYLAQMLRQYSGDLKKSLAAYNAGPQNVEKHNGVPPFDETKNYIARVLGYFNYLNE
jgi:Rod binding domain-containing protein